MEVLREVPIAGGKGCGAELCAPGGGGRTHPNAE